MWKDFEILDSNLHVVAKHSMKPGTSLSDALKYVRDSIKACDDLFEIDTWKWVRDTETLEKVSVDRHLKISPKVLSEKSR